MTALAARIKALIGHKHHRLQDVPAAPVVQETAIVKVHRQTQSLEIQSHCKTSWECWYDEEARNVHALLIISTA